MGAFARARANLTSVVFLRRISRELHRMNELEELRLSCEYPAQYKAYKATGTPNFSPALARTSRMVGISTPAYADWSKYWEEKHPRQETDDDVFNHP